MNTLEYCGVREGVRRRSRQCCARVRGHFIPHPVGNLFVQPEIGIPFVLIEQSIVLPLGFGDCVAPLVQSFRGVLDRHNPAVRSPEEVMNDGPSVRTHERGSVRIPQSPRLRLHSVGHELLHHGILHCPVLVRLLQLRLLELLHHAPSLSVPLLVFVQSTRADASDRHLRNFRRDLPILQGHADLGDAVVQTLHMRLFGLGEHRLVQRPLEIGMLSRQDCRDAPLLGGVLGLDVPHLSRVLLLVDVLVRVPLILVERRLVRENPVDVALLIGQGRVVAELVVRVHGLIDGLPVVAFALEPGLPVVVAFLKRVEQTVAVQLLRGRLHVQVVLVLRVLIVVDLLLLSDLNPAGTGIDRLLGHLFLTAPQSRSPLSSGHLFGVRRPPAAVASRPPCFHCHDVTLSLNEAFEREQIADERVVRVACCGHKVDQVRSRGVDRDCGGRVGAVATDRVEIWRNGSRKEPHQALPKDATACPDCPKADVTSQFPMLVGSGVWASRGCFRDRDAANQD